jgi:propanol-preferring alcohol dehydrogenase
LSDGAKNSLPSIGYISAWDMLRSTKIKMGESMLAMVLEKSGALLQERKLPIPEPSSDQVLIKVHACGVCRTDLHIMDGELPNLQYPIIPGHQIVGEIVKLGKNHTHWFLRLWLRSPFAYPNCSLSGASRVCIYAS